MKSMTGYAKRQFEIEGHKLSVEIKTLNSKQLDVNVKLPFAYREKELEIRTLLARLERGKIDFLMVEETTVSSVASLNKELAEQRYNELSAFGSSLNLSVPDQQIFSLVSAQSEVWSSSCTFEMSEAFWNELQKQITEAIDQVDEFRSHEGNIMWEDIAKHVDLIEKKLSQIPQYEAERIASARERISNYMTEFQVKDIDQNRLEQEMIYYLEKLDITEEKVRLQKHIDYFRATVANEVTCGKKLGFVAQEMGREINTTGSKANHVQIQQLVVEMKDELEKIKEQLGNIL